MGVQQDLRTGWWEEAEVIKETKEKTYRKRWSEGMAALHTGLGEAGWRRLQYGTPEVMGVSTLPRPVPPWACTCHNGLPVPFPIWPDPDELLPQEGGHIRVAVHKYPDGVL